MERGEALRIISVPEGELEGFGVKRLALFAEGMGLEEFRADDKTVDAVVRNLGIIGEAARYVPFDM